MSIYCKYCSTKIKHLLQVPQKKLPPELEDIRGKNVYDYHKQMVPYNVYLYKSSHMRSDNCSSQVLEDINEDAMNKFEAAILLSDSDLFRYLC